ncbi:MAG TPA: SulP family inorganic anion transporter [Chryseosolibacter sp.]|nr:SulP family inorganic anion transporter [Chryseosolibacter sp.]
MTNQSVNPFKNLQHDFPSSVVVFLVALPLCLGIALASGAPLFAGIISGIVGGIVIGSFSGSSLSVSGPAAGLTTIVLGSIAAMGSFQAFLTTVMLAGLIQISLGFLRAGTIGNYFPSSVIKGMLAAIGIILILKQIPHAVGYDRDFEGDESFFQRDGENTFTELLKAFEFIHPAAVLICVVSLGILILWEQPFMKRQRFTVLVPAPLVVVFIGIVVNELFKTSLPGYAIQNEHLVNLPIAGSIKEFAGYVTTPDLRALLTSECWTVAFTIAIVASLESLLSIDAVDKLDPLKRITPLNQELKAQGLGNLVCGLIGGLPVTAVIVRSSANVTAGARTKTSAILHGILLFLTVILIPGLLNKIPYAALAAILLTVGYKLAKPSIAIAMYKKGKDQFIPFAVTVIAIVLSDLLTGIFIGILVGLAFVLKSNFHKALFSVNEDSSYLIRLTKDVSFLNKALLRNTFRSIPDGSYVIIDGARSSFIDYDILETINDFRESAASRNITVELKQTMRANNPLFKS